MLQCAKKFADFPNLKFVYSFVQLRSNTCSNLLVKQDFLAWPNRPLKCCNTHDSLGPKKFWVEVSKKVKHNFVPQGASELQDVKVGNYWKLHFYVVNKIRQTLIDYNSDVHWGTRSCFTILETSNQYLLEPRLSWVLQHCKHLSGHAEKSSFT